MWNRKKNVYLLEKFLEANGFFVNGGIRENVEIANSCGYVAIHAAQKLRFLDNWIQDSFMHELLDISLIHKYSNILSLVPQTHTEVKLNGDRTFAPTYICANKHWAWYV